MKDCEPWRYPDWGEDDLAAWPSDVLDFLFYVTNEFNDGNLEPLGRYIAEGYVIPRQLAHCIGQAICARSDSEAGPVKMSLERTNADRQPLSVHQWEHDRKVEIGIMVEKLLRDNPSLKRQDAVADVSASLKRMGDEPCGKTYVDEALSYLRRMMGGGFPEKRHLVFDPFPILEAFPDYWSENPRPKRRVRAKKP